jgi:hypothetical protein
MSIKPGTRLVAVLLASAAISVAASQSGYAHGGHGGSSHPPVHGPGSSHNPIVYHPVHGPGSSHNPIVYHPVHGPGSSHNPIVYNPVVRDHRHPPQCSGGFHPHCRPMLGNAPGGVIVTATGSRGGRYAGGGDTYTTNGNVRDHR